MDGSRRRVIAACSGGLAAVFLHSAMGLAQSPSPQTTPNSRRDSGASRDSGAEEPNAPPGPAAAKAVLEQRQKDIKKDVDKLFELAQDLKTEVDNTDSTAVLSMAMVKKAETIEKLAKQIRDHARG
jgi:hypothetical protein